VAAAVAAEALRRLTARQLRLLGLASTAAGIVGLLVLITRDTISWLGTAPPELRRYTVQRILFPVGTNADLPLLQVTAAGAVCWVVGMRRKTRNDSGDAYSAGSTAGDDR